MRTTGGGSPSRDASRRTSRWRRYQRVILVGATAAGMLTFPLRSALGALSSTVVLTGGSSGQPNDVRLVAADSTAIVFAVTDPELAAGASTYVRARSGSTRPLPARFNATGITSPTLVGDMLGAYVPSSAAEPASFVYTTVDGSAGGDEPVTAGEFQGTSADGYLYSAVPGATAGVHIYDVNITTKETTDLGAVPGDPAFLTATASPSGVLLETKETGDSSEQPSLYYVGYADPNTFVQLASSVPIQGAPVLGTNSVAWLENATVYDNTQTFDPTATKLMRVTLSGSVVERLGAPNAYEVATTPTYTGVLTASSSDAAASFATIATRGGQQTVYQPPVGADMLSTGTGFVVTEGGTPSTAGIYTLPSAAGPAVLLHSAGAATLRASTIAVSPARVVWRDNGIGAGLWSRVLGTAQTTLAAGDPTIVSAQPDPTSEESVSSSGNRVAYVEGGNTASTSATSTLWLAAAGQVPRSIGQAAPDDELTLSGNRLLQQHDDGSATLLDLVSGIASNLPAPIGPWSGAFLGRTTYQLWGNELAWLASDGSVWFKNLAAGTTTEVSGAVVGAGEAVIGSVAVAAGIVAWTEGSCPIQGTNATTSACHDAGLNYRNALTLGQTYTVPAAQPTRIQLSNGYLAFDDSSNGSSWVDVTPLYSTIVEHIAALSSGGAGESEFSISGSMLGWIGSDNLPHAAALPHLAAKPWYLGNGGAATSLVTDGAHTWDADFFASDGLTQCAVTISSGVTKVRVLPCDTTQTIVGEAVVSWDGRNAAGSVVSPGTYSWTLTGADADGPLLNADGSGTPINGTITTTAHSIVSLACASSSGAAYNPVTLTATVAGSSAGSIEFFDGSASLGSSAVSGGVATLTTDQLGPGSHSMTATFTPAGQGPSATSAPVALMLSDSSSHVGVVIQPSTDPGTLTMTTPYTPSHPLDLGALQLNPTTNQLTTSVDFGSPTNPAIEVTDGRVGNPNWTVSVQTNDFVNPATHALINGENTGITDLTAVTAPDGVIGANGISFTDIPPPDAPLDAGAKGTDGLGGKPHQLASTTNGGNGTVGFYGIFTLEAPTSTPAGAYQGTLVFTIG
jgi:Big-like domain-containing protein